MRYIEAERAIDLTLEGDELDVERVSECLHYCRQRSWNVGRVVIRGAQKRSIMRDAQPHLALVDAVGGISEIFGVTIVEREDDLTPRERQVKRTLAEMKPTRAEQVAEHLRKEAEQVAAQQPPDGWPGPMTADDIHF